MDRRESIKTILLGSLGAGVLLTGCEPEDLKNPANTIEKGGGYGRTPKEVKHDEELRSETFFNPHELATIALLTDLILPAQGDLPPASDVGVPDFIEFMAKDYPPFQLRLRGGLMWLDSQTNTRFNKEFIACSKEEQQTVLDEIAWYDPEAEEPQDKQAGINFFNLIRNLTLTGYYTTETGFKELGYQGNRPNVWDGVPDAVLKEHGLSYEKEWLEKCVDQSTREVTAEWDEDGNLLT